MKKVKLTTSLTLTECSSRFSYIRFKTLVNLYLWGQCIHRFTCISLCSKGDTKVLRYQNRTEKSQSAYERAFYPNHKTYADSIRWLEYESRKHNRDICFQFCGHGGQHWIAGGAVVGFDPETKTVYQYHGCHWEVVIGRLSLENYCSRKCYI